MIFHWMSPDDLMCQTKLIAQGFEDQVDIDNNLLPIVEYLPKHHAALASQLKDELT
jgi:hypothetical protein